MKLYLLVIFALPWFTGNAQFVRSELPTQLDTPWEITYGPDGFLWITEAEGTVSRVNPTSGDKQIVYSASDYFDSAPSENSPECPDKKIGRGTLGLALHPDFLNSDSAFIYFVYSYNQGDVQNPQTKFKISRLKWDNNSESVLQADDLITNLSNGYDHWGGRLLSAKIAGNNYLFYSIGDLGLSEDSHPTCYSNQADNPNNFTQDPDSLNGKIHRFNMDGSIPFDNPISGNSFYTRGHRNPQGLAYNHVKEIVYGIEHGDRTDDEVNLLQSGMNYGWKNVRGYHNDSSFIGEEQYVNNYVPNQNIPNDQLMEPITSWCTDTAANGSSWSDWCTIAPSDGEYYELGLIYPWSNCLLVTTLKDGNYSDRGVRALFLNEDGTQVLDEQTFFTADQALNGRLRDLTFVPYGNRVFLINNGGADRDKITVYDYTHDYGPISPYPILIYPNPSTSYFDISSQEEVISVLLFDVNGRKLLEEFGEITSINVQTLSQGQYIVEVRTIDENVYRQAIWKQ